MENSEKNNSVVDVDKEQLPTLDNPTTPKNRMAVYLSLLLVLLIASMLLEITDSQRNHSILQNIQLFLLFTSGIISAYIFLKLRRTHFTLASSSKMRDLNDRIALKSHSLEILYDSAAGVNDLYSLDQLLTRFLITLKNLTQAPAGFVRLLSDENKMRLVAKTGISDETDLITSNMPLSQCLVGNTIANSSILKSDLDDIWPDDLKSYRGRGLTVITIPIQYSGKTLGAYHILTDNLETLEQNEIIQLFTSIGRHLGIVVEKINLENHARRLSIIEERTSLANELHDSLAQTLASLRFQITMVDETISQSKDRTGILQIRSIKDGLDQANNQLRELLSHFRTRMDERGLIPAIESLADRFQKETGISAFFQNEAKYPISSPAVEVQVLHIVQEALTNVRKHSHAENVRVLIKSDDKGNYHVLVEDDGQGMKGKDIVGGPGEHIGLSIMQERAERLSGSLTIETEPGEGTRVELSFHALSDRKPL